MVNETKKSPDESLAESIARFRELIPLVMQDMPDFEQQEQSLLSNLKVAYKDMVENHQENLTDSAREVAQLRDTMRQMENGSLRMTSQYEETFIALSEEYYELAEKLVEQLGLEKFEALFDEIGGN